MGLDDLPLSVVLDELATTYETVAALEPTAHAPGGKVTGKPGSRIPPGMSEVLDEDEYLRAVAELDDWAEFVAHVILDEGIAGPAPDSTPGRLRFARLWVSVIEHGDVMLRYALEFDAREHLVRMRRLARRGVRKVHTRSACLDVTCSGEYVADIEGPEVDGDLVCSGCGDRVPHEKWSRWGSRSEWVTVEHAMKILRVDTKMAVYQRAKREGWRRQGEGREVRYHVDDVEQRAEGLSA